MISLFFTNDWVTYLVILGVFLLIMRLLKHFNEKANAKEKSFRRVRFRLPSESSSKKAHQEVLPEVF